MRARTIQHVSPEAFAVAREERNEVECALLGLPHWIERAPCGPDFLHQIGVAPLGGRDQAPLEAIQSPHQIRSQATCNGRTDWCLSGCNRVTERIHPFVEK